MTDTEHRLLMALYRAESILRQARRAATGTAEEGYVQAATNPALQILDEHAAAADRQFEQLKEHEHVRA